MIQQLFLVRGIPGQGKSTFGNKLASAINAKWYESDHWRGAPDTGRVYSKELNPVAHGWCLGMTAQALWDRHNVVVSNTFVRLEHLREYFLLVKDLRLKGHTIEVTVLHVQGPIGRSIHKAVSYQGYIDEWQDYKGEFDNI